VKIYNDIYSANIRNPFVTVGIFDGVHLGHQAIFKQIKELAQNSDGESVVITFWPHPKTVVGVASSEISLINSLDEKINLVEEQGIDHFIILPFTKEFSQLSSEKFIEHYLFMILKIKGLVVGFDHKFGKDREGNFEVLTQYAQKYNFIIQKIDALSIGNVNISSTNIRNALVEGNIELANSYLSRNFSISGLVANGKKIGRDLGFPTANIEPDFANKLIPRDGVYAVQLSVQGFTYLGMLNIGHRPTIAQGNEAKTIEVHIIDFEGDLYHQKIEISFYHRIRDELKFNSLDDLISQLKKDKSQIQTFFASPIIEK